MRKLNNYGITTIEILLCFVLVFIMAFSMYGTVSSYNDKRVIEKDKNEILSYKYLLTKTIQDDFVNNELSHVSIENNFDPSGKKTYILHCTLKNGTKKILKIEQTLGYSSYNPTGLKNQSDSFMISYGTEGDLVEYPLPNLGQTKIEADPSKGISEHIVQELSIQDVKIEVLEHQVLSIQIVFYHPNFGNEYGISIMAPVNYVPDINLPLTSYTLLYDDNGGSGCHDKSIQKMEDDYWGELCTPTKNKNRFDGWKDGANFVTAETKVTKNVTVKAMWTPTYTLEYNDNSGSGCSSQKIEKLKNEKWGTLCTPTRSNYKFAGWYDGDEEITADNKATSDITVKAKWTPIYTLTYDDDGGSGCGSKSIKKEKNLKWGTLCTPSKTGNTFAGWYDGNKKITSDTKATKNIKVKAKWRINQVLIKLNANGGSLKVSGNGYTIDSAGWIKYNGSNIIHTIPYGDTLTTNKGLLNWNNDDYLSISKTGYTIDSSAVWSKSSNWSENAFNQSDAYPASDFCNASVGDCTAELYANWRPMTYRISYDYNSGRAPSSGVPRHYTYGVGETINGSPTRSGYTFNGWSFNSNLSSVAFVKNISNTTTGNKTLYAKWCQNCASVSHGTCRLSADTAGTCSYTTSCNSGYYMASGGSTYNPICKRKIWEISSPRKYTSTLEDALDIANSGATVTLLVTYEDSSSPSTTKKNVTVDLGGHTLTTNHAISINEGHKMSVGNGTITSPDTTFGVKGELDISSGTYMTTAEHGHVVAVGLSDDKNTNPTFNMTGGKLTSNTSDQSTILAMYGALVNIENATVESTATNGSAMTVQGAYNKEFLTKVYFKNKAIIKADDNQAVYVGKGDYIYVYALEGSSVTGSSFSMGLTSGHACYSDKTTLKGRSKTGKDSIYIEGSAQKMGVNVDPCKKNL